MSGGRSIRGDLVLHRLLMLIGIFMETFGDQACVGILNKMPPSVRHRAIRGGIPLYTRDYIEKATRRRFFS